MKPQHRLADQRLYPMALLASDIDHFKRINDNWGHDKGDEVLQLVARAMQHNVRSNDLVARFGGEEFMVLLTKIDLQGAEQVAKRIGLELRNDRELLPKGPALTLSFSITSISNADQLEGALGKPTSCCTAPKMLAGTAFMWKAALTRTSALNTPTGRPPMALLM